MNRGAWISTHLLRWQHCISVSCVVMALVGMASQPAFAQSEGVVSVSGSRATLRAGQRAPMRNEHGGEHSQAPIVGESSNSIDMEVAGRPPLPFRAPQIGPLIRQVSMDDIARRTTAFIPQSLDYLTPVDFPDEEKWIRVDLSEQTVVAYQHETPIRAFLISSGLPGTPTVTGQFRIRMKVEEQTMVGGEGSMFYNLPGVKWVQYFYEDYGFHGTYWHSNFGHPMSHGCINMTDADAKWLFDWAGPTWDGETVWYPSTSDNPGTMVIVTP